MTKPEKIVLYCLPFAGGNSYSYRLLKTHFCDFIEMVSIELPGRGKRSHEPLLTCLESLAQDVVRQVQQKEKHHPYAIFGHSMGAILGYLATHQLLTEGFPLPQHLFFSGRRAPSISVEENRHKLPKPEFLMALKKLEGCPKEILENEEFIDIFEPILRADFKAIETWNVRKFFPLDIPITVLLGTHDTELNETEALAWEKETLHPVTIKKFQGGHFFIFDQTTKVCQSISQTLRSVLLN